jgi:hypothetical protein
VNIYILLVDNADSNDIHQVLFVQEYSEIKYMNKKIIEFE